MKRFYLTMRYRGYEIIILYPMGQQKGNYQ